MSGAAAGPGAPPAPEPVDAAAARHAFAARHPFAAYTGPALAWVLLIAWGSLAPPDQLPSLTFAVWDKLQHGGAYALLGVLLLRAWAWGRPAAHRQRAVVFALAMGFGLYLEVLQAYSGYRSFDWADVAGNALGLAVGLLLHALLARRRVRRPHRTAARR